MDTGSIEKLLQIKNKSGASKADKNNFQNEWLSYVREHGFNDTAETFLYDGFSFLGMVPFITYLSNTSDKQETIHKLLSGKRFYRNKSITFKLMLHLLALLIEKLPDEKALIMLVVRCLPELSINKEGKRLGDMAKSVDKYFVKVLSHETEFPDLKSLGLRPVIIESFRKMMAEALHILLAEGHGSPEEASIMTNIEKWLSDNDKLPADADKSEDVVPAEMTDGTLTQCGVYVDKTFPGNSKTYTWRDGLNITAYAIKQLEKELIRLQMNNENLLSENTRVKTDRDNLQCALNRERECCEQQKTEISRLFKDVSLLRQQVVALEIKIRDKDKEIEERARLADMLSRDRTEQSKEALKRLAANLRVEYRDFLDAENLPMNADLGENMRLQLKSIFDILKKNGLNLE
jgi:3-deoxy-D-manno-octulosonate 8-phosphate phosphatase KdsC-like HAD superfamily phosphatase